MKLKILIVLFVIYIQSIKAENFLCTEDFCATFREKSDCIPLGDACIIHDSLNLTESEKKSGEIFSAEVPCGCCEVCMEHIKEGDYCTIGSPDSAPPMMVCGPGLYCKAERVNDVDTEFRCRKMDTTTCSKEQILYDKLKVAGEIGKFMIRPDCDGDGNYKPIKCNPGQTCFCVSADGTRIFGEEIHSKNTELTMQCECSRLNHKFKHLMPFKNPVLTARCLANGNFDSMQCMSDQCACVEMSSGFPTTTNYNMSLKTYSELPCYNRSFHLNYKYLHDCEAIQAAILDEIHESELSGFHILDSQKQECQPDGWFHRIASNETHQFCVDHYNREIEDFQVPINSEDAKNMNCYCAKTRFLLNQQKVIELTPPDCCANGNYKRVQCRQDVCYCVDFNGLQTEKEVPLQNADSLECNTYNGQLC